MDRERRGSVAPSLRRATCADAFTSGRKDTGHEPAVLHFTYRPIIFVHELGHLLAAKLVGVQVHRFSIGFGRPLARLRIGETEYCIAPIPLGGYVQMLGQQGQEILTWRCSNDR